MGVVWAREDCKITFALFAVLSFSRSTLCYFLKRYAGLSIFAGRRIYINIELMMMYLLKNNIFMLIGILAGAVGGYLYFHFVGCNGTCLIASSPWISTIYGAVLGGLVVNMFRSKRVTGNPG